MKEGATTSHSDQVDTLTSEQVRAARNLIGWSQKDLVLMTGISLPTIRRLEGRPGPLAAQKRTIDAIRASFQYAGVSFIFGPEYGVVRRKTLSLGAKRRLMELQERENAGLPVDVGWVPYDPTEEPSDEE